MVLLAGETGVGKTRLVEEVAEQAAAADAVVLAGRAVQGGGAYRALTEALLGLLRGGAVGPDTAAALGPYRAVLGQLLPDWSAGADLPGLVADPAVVLGEAVARLLGEVGREHGCVLLVEDAQWADGDTLAVVAHLAGAVRRLPVLVVVASRDDEPASDTINRLRGAAEVLSAQIGRLDHEQSEELARWIAQETGRVFDEATRERVRLAEGLPYLVEELAGESGPDLSAPTFAAVVESRWTTLAPAHRQALAAAAVMSPALDWSLLAEVSGLDRGVVIEALREATEARLIVAAGTELRWRHALTRDVIRDALLPPERALMAERGAQALLARGRPDDSAAAAELLLDGGDPGAAAGLWLEQARHELRRGALHSAGDLLDRVEQTGELVVELACERVRLLSLLGRPVEALTLGASVLELATGEEHAELALRVARAAVGVGRWDDARTYVDRAGRPDDPRSSSLLADAAHGAGRIEEAAVHAERAVSLAEVSGRHDELCEALVIEGKLARLHDRQAATSYFRRAAQVAAEHGLTGWRVEALIGLGSLELLERETSQSLPVARDLAEGAGLLGQVTASLMLLTDHDYVAGGPASTQAQALLMIDLGQRLQLPVAEAFGRHLVALGHAMAGRRRALDDELATWAFPAEAGPEAESLTPAVRSMAALATHDLQTAARLMDQAVTPLLGHASAAPIHYFGLWALLRTVTADRGDEARTALAALPAVMRPANRAALLCADAIVAGRNGRGDAADDLFAQAQDLVVELPWLRRLLQLLTVECAVVDTWGQPVPVLRGVLAELVQHDDELLARTCRDLLRRAGAPTRRGRGATDVPRPLAALGVTSREMDVLRLVADGATNAQVAEQLFLSIRTVETHVANLLRRTGAANREELRTWVTDPHVP